jgi:hypothetical protein
MGQMGTQNMSDQSAADVKNSGTLGGLKHWVLGVLLLIVPFVLFVALIAIWPVRVASDAVDFEEAVRSEVQAETAVAAAKVALAAKPQDAAAKASLEKAEKSRLEAIEQKALAEKRLKTAGSTAATVGGWLDRILGPSPEIRLLLLVMISAAIGSSVQAAKSYAAFTGRNEYNPNWNWWYFLRFPSGIGIALLMYFVIRGGFMVGSIADQSVAGSVVNPFGVAALSALAGMFARQASDKLEELFGNLFRTDQKPASGSPTLVGTPPQVKVGASGKDLTIVVAASNVADGATATVGGQVRAISAVSAKGFTLELKDADVVKVQALEVKVTNPANKGGKSLAFTIQVVAAAPAPAPTITPAPVPPAVGATGPALDMAVNGQNFVNGAKGRIGGADRVTAFNSDRQLTVTLLVSDVTNAGSLSLTVRNPDGTESAPVMLTIQ